MLKDNSITSAGAHYSRFSDWLHYLSLEVSFYRVYNVMFFFLFQIYNEQITDLLDPSQKNLMVKRTFKFYSIYILKENMGLIVFR